MKSIIEFISNMEILLLHVEEFCDHSEEKTVFRDKCGNFTSNRHRITQTGIEILGLNPLQNSLLTILSILEKILL